MNRRPLGLVIMVLSLASLLAKTHSHRAVPASIPDTTHSCQGRLSLPGWPQVLLHCHEMTACRVPKVLNPDSLSYLSCCRVTLHCTTPKEWAPAICRACLELHPPTTAEAQEAKAAHSHQSLLRDRNGTQFLNMMIAGSYKHRGQPDHNQGESRAQDREGPVRATAPEGSSMEGDESPSDVQQLISTELPPSTLRLKPNLIPWDPKQG